MTGKEKKDHGKDLYLTASLQAVRGERGYFAMISQKGQRNDKREKQVQ